MTEKIILWGTGTYSRSLLKKYFLPMDVIEAVVDSDERLWGSVFWGHQVKSPEIIKDQNMQSRTVVIGTSRYYQEVLGQFKEMETDRNVISIDEYIVRFPSKEKMTTVGYYEKTAVGNLIEQMQSAGEIRQKQLEHARVLASRDEAIKRLPKGGESS